MLVRLLRSILAGVCLAFLLVGIPVALVRLVGFPSLDDLTALDVGATLRAGLTSGALVAVLAAGLWLAWLRLLVAVVAEVPAALRSAGPGGARSASRGPTRRLAASLLGGLLGALPSLPVHAAALPAVAPSAVVAPDGLVVLPPTGPAASPARSEGVPVEWVVAHGESLWHVAEAALGDGARWREVHDVNLGAEVAPGVHYRPDSVLQPGWVLRLPGEPVTGVTVRPGDSLSSIAERALGAADRWPELFRANAGRTFDGRTLDDPSLLLPGWRLVLPDQAVDPGAAAPEALSAPAAPSPGEARPLPAGAGDARPDVTVPTAAECVPPANLVPAAGPVPAQASAVPGEPAAPVAAVTGGPRAAGAGADSEVETGSAWRARLGAGGGVLLATGLAGILVSRRRRRLRGASPTAAVRLPSPASQQLEQSLVAGADPLAVARLDLALRALVASTGGRARPSWVRRGDDGSLAVGLVEPVPVPAPWRTRADATVLLDPHVPTSALVPAARSAGAPCPALVELGRTTDGATLAVDLEALGLLQLDGPPEVAVSLVRAFLAVLATSPLSDRVRVVTTLPVPALGERVVQVDHADAAVDAAVSLAEPIRRALAAGGHASGAALRSADPSEAWDSTVLALLAGEVDPSLLHSLPAGGGIAVVTTVSGVAAPWRLRAETDATWVIEPLGLAVRPYGLAARELDALATLLLEADQVVEDEPIVSTVVACATHPTWRSSTAVEPPPAGAGSPWGPPPPASHAAGPAPVGGTAAAQAPDDDQELLAELGQVSTWAMLVRVLGRPEVVTPELVAVHFEKAKALELVCWLAEHPDTATRSGARAALWELDVRDATFANVVSEARRALARTLTPPEGEEWIGRGQGERLPLHAGVRTDVDVVRRTARVCRDLPDHHAVPALRRVLALVRDVPYASSGYLWPDAGGRTSSAILAVTAAAADLATRLLDADDVEGAFWATAQGLRVLPGHEELVCLRMEAHARRGDLAGVRAEYASYERVVLSDPWSDGGVAPKVAAARSRLLTAERPPPARVDTPGVLVGSG